MKCDDARTLSEAEAEGLLLPLDRAAVAEHQHDCPACGRAAAESRALSAALDALPDPPLPSSFAHSVMGQLPEMLPAVQGAAHLLRWGALAAALVFVFLASLSLLLEGAGPDVAHEVLDPLAASLTLAGLILGQGATLVAALLGTLSSALVSADLVAKLAFCAVFVVTNAALLRAVSHFRPANGGARMTDR